MGIVFSLPEVLFTNLKRSKIMAKGIHKGTELNNVQETWNENERRRAAGEDIGGATGSDEGLQRVIREEAAEYDGENKSDRVLGGERATLNDDGGEGAGDE
jgi:hypothetical protein